MVNEHGRSNIQKLYTKKFLNMQQIVFIRLDFLYSAVWLKCHNKFSGKIILATLTTIPRNLETNDASFKSLYIELLESGKTLGVASSI